MNFKIFVALLCAGGAAAAVAISNSSSETSWQEVVFSHWRLLLGTAAGIFLGVMIIFEIFNAICAFLEVFFERLGNFFTPLRFLILLTLLGAAYLYYKSMPQTRAECIASEIRRMGQGTNAAVRIADAICKDKGF
jgi:hypothetical protein